MDSATTNSTDMEVVVQARKMMHDMTAAGLQQLGPCPADLEETIIDIPIPDGTSYRTIIIRPASIIDIQKCPLIIFFHGGSFTVGSPEFCLSSARGFARRLGAIVACPSYKYIPEHPFPGSVHSAWEISAWLSRPENLHQGPLHGTNVEYDPSLGLVLAGISAGANLASIIAGISAARKAIPDDEKIAKLTEGLSEIDPWSMKGVFLSVPLLLQEKIVPAKYASLWTSRAEHPNALIVSVQNLAATDRRLQPDHSSPWYSPFNLDLEKISADFAPRVYFQAGQLDSLRDDAVVFEASLREKGVAETRIDVIQNSGHVGWCTVTAPEAHTVELRTKSLDGMAWLLDKTWDSSQELPY